MKEKLNNRAKRRVSLPTVMLMLAFSASFASVGHAQDIPQITVKARLSPSCDQNLSLRDEMQKRARRAVWDTRVSVATDLHARLYRQHWGASLLAGIISDKRG
jgi:hypothetical protein